MSSDWSRGTSVLVVWVACDVPPPNRTKTVPPSFAVGRVPRLIRLRTAPSVMPSATAAWATVRRLWFACGSPVWFSLTAPYSLPFGGHAQALSGHPRASGGQREAPAGISGRVAIRLQSPPRVLDTRPSGPAPKALRRQPCAPGEDARAGGFWFGTPPSKRQGSGKKEGKPPR